MTRHFWLLVHRYAGLFMAFFLIVIGLTGSIIVFNPELNDWFDPPPIVLPRASPKLDAYDLRDRAQARMPHGLINNVALFLRPDEAYTAYVEPRIDPKTNEPFELDATVLWLDPYTGVELKRRKVDDSVWPITSQNIMQIINRLHYQLAIPGAIGTWLFGIVALVWTIDCFVSAYLTFPLRIRKRKPTGDFAIQTQRKSWLVRWWNPAWLVKWSGRAYRINFDLHRAGGLWVWIMLLAIAWSSVGFNLGEQIYIPVMKAVFNMPNPYGDAPPLAKPEPEPSLGWREARTIAQSLMAEQARINRFSVTREYSLFYIADKGLFQYNVRSDRDLSNDYGSTFLLFNNNGKLMSLFVPTGQNAGSTMNTWIFALHMAKIWGLPFRIFVTCVGILVVVLSGTGVYIWWKKRKARVASHTRVTRVVA